MAKLLQNISMAASNYFWLTKPRLAAVNLLCGAAGYVLAFNPINWLLFFCMLAGLGSVIGSACVFNNIYDREIDAKMARTKMRATVTGVVTKKQAFRFGAVLLAAGIALLYPTGPLALAAALVGFVTYVFLYTPLKHKSALALYVGAVAGATPPVVGYLAAGGAIDWVAYSLFAFLFLWQLPHFMAIAVYRFSEYNAAGVPLFIKSEKSVWAQKNARGIFHASLLILSLACLAAFLSRALL